MDNLKQGAIYTDRHEAGYVVGKMLEEKYKNQNVLVFGIPRGGVLIAFEVSRILDAELSAVITKKLPHPLEKELTIGVTAEDGSVYLTSLAQGLREETINRIVKAQSQEIKSRIEILRKGSPLPDIEDRVVIICDDGIATGSTIIPVIELCKKKGASRVVVAAPVAGNRFIAELEALADEVIIAAQPDLFFAVAHAYADFRPVTDDEAAGLLGEFAKR